MTHSKILMAAMAGAIMSTSLSAKADDTTSSSPLESNLSAELVSGYIWRGQDLGGVSIQPGFGIGWKGLSLGMWGSASFEKDDTKEVDILLGYEYKGFSVGITDYWFNDGPGYFKYGAHDTAHVFELGLGYDFGPVALNWFTNFAGNDGVTAKGKRAYSSYVEVSAPFKIGFLDWKAELGATPWSTSFYNSHGFAVINIGIGAAHTFKVSDLFGLTLSAKGTFNPRDSKAYLVAGVAIASL